MDIHGVRCEMCLNIVYMCFYLLIIYGGKELEGELIVSTRKFHEPVFDILL